MSTTRQLIVNPAPPKIGARRSTRINTAMSIPFSGRPWCPLFRMACGCFPASFPRHVADRPDRDLWMSATRPHAYGASTRPPSAAADLDDAVRRAFAPRPRPPRRPHQPGRDRRTRQTHRRTGLGLRRRQDERTGRPRRSIMTMAPTDRPQGQRVSDRAVLLGAHGCRLRFLWFRLCGVGGEGGVGGERDDCGTGARRRAHPFRRGHRGRPRAGDGRAGTGRCDDVCSDKR